MIENNCKYLQNTFSSALSFLYIWAISSLHSCLFTYSLLSDPLLRFCSLYKIHSPVLSSLLVIEENCPVRCFLRGLALRTKLIDIGSQVSECNTMLEFFHLKDLFWGCGAFSLCPGLSLSSPLLVYGICCTDTRFLLKNPGGKWRLTAGLSCSLTYLSHGLNSICLFSCCHVFLTWKILQCLNT